MGLISKNPRKNDNNRKNWKNYNKTKLVDNTDYPVNLLQDNHW